MTMTNKCDCLNDCGDDPDILKSAVQPCETYLSPSDCSAVDRFAAAMKRKLATARAKGRSGWDSPECTQQHLSNLLREHVNKGDPVDVANFCAFLSARGEMIAQVGPAVVPGAAIRRIEQTNFPNSPAQAALSAFLSAMFDQGLNGADMRAAMLWFCGFEECEEPSASTAQAALVDKVQYLGSADLADLQRLEDLIDDGQDYDLPKTRMVRLAELGAIRHHGNGYYSITAFGRLALDSRFTRLPLETVDECNERLSAEHKEKMLKPAKVASATHAAT